MAQQTAFQIALAALVAATATVTANKGDKDTQRDAERNAAWAAFDEAGQDAARAVELAEEVAKAKGVKAESIPVYRQRAKDAASTYYEAIKGADRAKINPYSRAKSLREGAAKVDARTLEIGAHLPEAKSMAAGVLATTVNDLEARILAGDGTASNALAAALETVKAKAALRQTIVSTITGLMKADDETVAFALEAFAGFKAHIEGLEAQADEARQAA